MTSPCEARTRAVTMSRIGGCTALLLAAVGCTSDPDPVSPPTTVENVHDDKPLRPTLSGVAAPGAWVSCALYSDDRSGQAECATFALPLDWSQPAGATVPVFVKRIPAQGTPRADLWLLAGGPGGAGDDLEWFAETLGILDPGLTVYVPDHRGTGRSGRLACPVQEAESSDGSRTVTAAEWPACIAAVQAQWGAGLGQFTTTAAARDVGALIAATPAGRPVFVYGVSYGTYWAQRWLHLHPHQAQGVVLDSLCPAAGCFVAEYDQNFDATARLYLDACALDADCQAHLGSDPWATAQATMAALADGHCPALGKAGIDRKRVRTSLAVLLTIWELRPYVPAVLYRIGRCSAADVDALLLLFSFFQPAVAGTPMAETHRSMALGTHIVLSEMLAAGPPPSEAALAALANAAVVSPDVAAPLSALHAAWPRYDHDAFVGQFPPTQVPLLMLNGTLDPQTPLAYALATAPHFQSPHQRLVVLPRAAHGTVVESPTLGSDQDCGLQLMLAFLQDPLAEPDLGCVADIAPLAFEGDLMLNVTLFGTSALWSPTPVSPAAATSARAKGHPTLRTLLRRIDELRGR